jgi:sugar (pentulose or hexulose) kinase
MLGNDARAASTRTAATILEGRTSLGIEVGSTRIKACLIADDDPATVLAAGSHPWENDFVDRLWTYSLDDVWSGIRSAFAGLCADVAERYDVTLTSVGAIGVSAMMHGYLAFGENDELLVPFRTWRNTKTAPAAATLTELFGVNIPQRWSIAHLFQAVLDEEPHVPRLRKLTTLSGYVHEKLTGRRVLGIGDASGMFPIDPSTSDYDSRMVEQFDSLAANRVPLTLTRLLPRVLVAGTPAGELTADGAALLDPTGRLRPGAAACAPEGDAGTGMVATCSVAPRTGNVSAGTSIFAMVVLEQQLEGIHAAIDIVTTPAGDPVAMVHCNNGASELGTWVAMFRRFADAAGASIDADTVFDVLFREALDGEPDAGGLVAYNYVAGEPLSEFAEGRPLFVRTPESQLNLATFMRAQLYGVFATLAIGMRALEVRGAALDRMFAHGGMFRTAGVAQRFLAGALRAPVVVGDTASEGGAWGIAVLAAYASSRTDLDLDGYLRHHVFAHAAWKTVDPDPADVAGFSSFLDRYRDGLAVERAAIDAL